MTGSKPCRGGEGRTRVEATRTREPRNSNAEEDRSPHGGSGGGGRLHATSRDWWTMVTDARAGCTTVALVPPMSSVTASSTGLVSTSASIWTGGQMEVAPWRLQPAGLLHLAPSSKPLRRSTSSGGRRRSATSTTSGCACSPARNGGWLRTPVDAPTLLRSSMPVSLRSLLLLVEATSSVGPLGLDVVGLTAHLHIYNGEPILYNS